MTKSPKASAQPKFNVPIKGIFSAVRLKGMKLNNENKVAAIKGIQIIWMTLFLIVRQKTYTKS